MKNVDQGTILYGFRSQKYPEIPNYAVIISARCDIAQNKINKLYYLSAVDANQWFCTYHGFHCALESHISSCHGNLKNNVSKYGINVDLLKSFERESAYAVLSSRISGKELTKALASYDELYDLIKPDSDFATRRAFFSSWEEKKKTSIISSFFSEINVGKRFHYHFLPKAAYTDSTDKSSGLIVDLQEIGVLSLEDAKRIYSPGIDYQALDITCDPKEKDRLIKKYWLETGDDFVYEEGRIKSPWCELLLQRFALDFIRIGVDGASSSDYASLAANIGKE